MLNMLSQFANDESGATAIEYGLIAALVSVAAIAALKTMSTQLVAVFNKVSGELATASG